MTKWLILAVSMVAASGAFAAPDEPPPGYQKTEWQKQHTTLSSELRMKAVNPVAAGALRLLPVVDLRNRQHLAAAPDHAELEDAVTVADAAGRVDLADFKLDHHLLVPFVLPVMPSMPYQRLRCVFYQIGGIPRKGENDFF